MRVNIIDMKSLKISSSPKLSFDSFTKYMKNKLTVAFGTFFAVYAFSVLSATAEQPQTFTQLIEQAKYREYTEEKNFNKVPLRFKIAQMMFLKYIPEGIPTQNNLAALNYVINSRHVGGVILSVPSSYRSLQQTSQSQGRSNTQKDNNYYTYATSLFNRAKDSCSAIPYFLALEEESSDLSASNPQKAPKACPDTNCLVSSLIDSDHKQWSKTITSFNNEGILLVFKAGSATSTAAEVCLQRYADLVKHTGFNQILIPDDNYLVCCNTTTCNRHGDTKQSAEFYGLSKEALDYLRQEAGFAGVFLNSSLTSKAVRQKYSFQTILIKAVAAGSNMIILPAQNVKSSRELLNRAVCTLLNAVKNKQLSVDFINNSYARIIALKKEFHIIPTKNHC